MSLSAGAKVDNSRVADLLGVCVKTKITQVFTAREAKPEFQVNDALIRTDARHGVRHDRVIRIAVAERDFLGSDIERDDRSIKDNVLIVRHPNQWAVVRIPDRPGSGRFRRKKIGRLAPH